MLCTPTLDRGWVGLRPVDCFPAAFNEDVWIDQRGERDGKMTFYALVLKVYVHVLMPVIQLYTTSALDTKKGASEGSLL